MAEWGRGMSGWRPEFRVAEEQLPARWDVLKTLIGRSVDGWTISDPARQRWIGVGPLVLAAEGGPHVEIGWQKWNDLSITLGTVDLGVPPEVAGQTCAWRASEPEAVAAIAQRTITGFAAVETPYFGGDADLGGELPMDRVAGWVITGLWIEFGDAGLHVYNGADENGYSSVVETTARVHRLG